MDSPNTSKHASECHHDPDDTDAAEDPAGDEDAHAFHRAVSPSALDPDGSLRRYLALTGSEGWGGTSYASECGVYE